MASYADQSLINASPNENYGAFLARKYNEGKLPHPSEMLVSSSHILVIDSRERNKQFYPNPAEYSIKFVTQYKQVTSIELKGTILPKTEYNVDTANNIIPFNVEDFITELTIKNPGSGYVDGVYNSAGGLISITEPGISGGTQAELTVVVTNGSVSSVTLDNPGTGYLRGHYGNLEIPTEGFYANSSPEVINRIPFGPNQQNRKKAQFNIEVGHELVATLEPGNYDFSSPNDSVNGLCREVTRALQVATQNAIDDGTITPVPGGPQTGQEYFPYSVGNTSDGSCYLFTPNPNASENSNVAIQRGEDDGSYNQSLFLELLWASNSYLNSTSNRLLGYGSKINVTFPNSPMDKTSGVTGDLVNPWISVPIESEFDYCLNDFPKYCTLAFGESRNDHADRIESTNDTLNKAFATLVFDGNPPDNVFREPSNNPVAGEGNSDFGTLLSKPGTLKGIKGADFDPKVLTFRTPQQEIKGISLRFQKLNGDLYDFHGKDHMLIFQINANDQNTGNRF